MRYLALVLALLVPACAGTAASETPVLPADLAVVYAITEVHTTGPNTAIYARNAASGAVTLIYRDPAEGDRILLRTGTADLVGAGRALPPEDICVIIGRPVVETPAACADAMSRLRLPASPGQQAQPEALFVVPLCFSVASPYGRWNRAPIFAVAPGERRFAYPAVRIGEAELPRPAIRIVSADGVEEWRIPLDADNLYVADLAWSPDGDSLAYLVMPLGDEHTLDESLLPRAGLYLANVPQRTTRLLYHCYADAVAWGPEDDEITVAARAREFWDSRYIGEVISISAAESVRQFSLRGSVVTMAYSPGGQWLAVQASYEGGQQVWVYHREQGWGQRLVSLMPDGGRLALLGWARLTRPETSRAQESAP